jgi:ribosomal-protein-alanine N-acetyltransferase
MKKTARLHIRRAHPEDAEFYAELENDEDVKKYVGGRSGKSELEYRHSIVELGQSYRCLTVEYIHGRLRIGRCGMITNESEVEIHYILAKQYWKRGFGFEIVSALISLASEVFPSRRMVAKVHPENVGSIAILKKLGLASTGNISSTGYDNGFLRFEKIDCPSTADKKESLAT